MNESTDKHDYLESSNDHGRVSYNCGYNMDFGLNTVWGTFKVSAPLTITLIVYASIHRHEQTRETAGFPSKNNKFMVLLSNNGVKIQHLLKPQGFYINQLGFLGSLSLIFN